MKNKIIEQFPFHAFSRAIIFGLTAGILAVAPMGFAETFSGRPTMVELMDTVTKGMECARGVRERCFATQYSTNPVSYRVSPPVFAGTNGGWYFDNNLVVILDSDANALVEYYADPDTVYGGTTNITMLVVTSLWAKLNVGDRTNLFTGTPAIGTNPPTYGDHPWRIYPETLDERRKVLNSLRYAPAMKGTVGLTNFGGNPYVAFSGSMQYYHSQTPAQGLYYTWSSGYLGGNGTYPVLLDDRDIGISGGSWYISVGTSPEGRGAGSPHRSGAIFFDTSTYTENPARLSHYAARIQFPEHIIVLNCWAVTDEPGGSGTAINAQATYVSSQIDVSADCKEEDSAWDSFKMFEFWPVIDFPFNYCK